MLESYVQSRERLLVTNQDTRRGANLIQKLGGVLLSFPTKKKQKPKAWDEGRNRKGRLLLKGHIRIIGDYGYEELPVLSRGFWIITKRRNPAEYTPLHLNRNSFDSFIQNEQG